MEYSSSCSKKSRKPYTLTKQRESWSNDEHERFIKALQLYNRDWQKIQTYVGTKTVVQIRSHAQKYFLKVMKSGIPDAIPPPRAKRRASDTPHGASCYTDSKHTRLLSSDAPSRQGSGKEDDSDEGIQLHPHQAGHNHGQQQHHSSSSKQQHLESHEPSAQLEAARVHISSEGLQHVYLFLAALFSQQQADLGAMLQRLNTRDRHLVTVLLKSLVDELTQPQHQHALQHPEQHTQGQEDAAHAEQRPQQHGQQPNCSHGSGGQQPGAAAADAIMETGAVTAAAVAAGNDAVAPATTTEHAAAAGVEQQGGVGAAGGDAEGDTAMPAAADVAEEPALQQQQPATQTQQPVAVQKQLSAVCVAPQQEQQQHADAFEDVKPAQPPVQSRQQQQQQQVGTSKQRPQAGPDVQQLQRQQQLGEVPAVADVQQQQAHAVTTASAPAAQTESTTEAAAAAAAAEGVQQQRPEPEGGAGAADAAPDTAAGL